MKSIMEEASSISKAIEAAWIRAEKPHEFSVKIFEEPEKNFFGMVTKSAKIALIFKHVEKKAQYKEQSTAPKHKPTQHTQEPIFSAPKEPVRTHVRKEQPKPEPMVREIIRKEQQPRKPVRVERDLAHTAAPAPREHEVEAPQQENKIFWTEDMIATTREWIETLLKNLNCDAHFTLEAKRYYLTIAFDKSVRETKGMEQQLFRSCAYLIMQMLRTKFKKQLRGLKVILHSPA